MRNGSGLIGVQSRVEFVPVLGCDAGDKVLRYKGADSA